jgi:hypothetical protein|tara:strand:+ start:100 stop:1197 length:1098 start_codon:yes stop_codon:yes gene_type:complete
MAESFYKSLDIGKDVVATRTLLHEAIPLTGTIVSGTYGTNNIKSYAHGMFQSVYDYPYLSSSANHIFDITVGVGSQSGLTVANQASKKLNIYNQMSQVLVGYDHTGSLQRFDQDGDILAGGTKLDSVFFMNYSRLLSKDEIKKGTFELELGVTPAYSQNGGVFASRIKITDFSGSDGFLVNSPVGEYGILYATQSLGTNVLAANQRYPVGLLFYQAGVAVISGSIFNKASAGGILNNSHHNVSMSGPSSTAEKLDAVLTGSNVDGFANNLRTRMFNLQFNNTVELNSSVYFCRINHNEYNYSTNPTYLNGSKIRVKTQSSDLPVSYITTVGLYNDNNELLATAKLSEPLKKTSDTEFTIRVRLDY